MGWVLLGILVLAASGCSVLAWMFIREKAEAKLQQEQAARHFNASVRRRLSKGLEGFDLYSLAEQSAIPRQTARFVGEEIYGNMARKALADGRVSAKERKTLDALAAALVVLPETQSTIETNAAKGVFRQAANAALSDGSLTTTEAAELDDLRYSLGLAKEQVLATVRSNVEDSYAAQFRSMLYHGCIKQSDIDDLQTMRQTFGLSPDRAFALVRQDAENAYAEYFTTIKQDGEISDVEEKSLNTLQSFLGIPAAYVQPFKEEIRWLRHLTDCRKGRLPSINTRKLLEGGELCHYEGPCLFRWQTSAKSMQTDGDLTISSRRIMFTSASRSHEFRPQKISDIILYGNGLEIILTSGRGTGIYIVERPDEVEAIITALARKQKYIAVEGFASEATRHIPRHIRQEVWSRDGGKCTECGAKDYLEFDHIIPHSRGGANTVNNVQLLCRRCNSVKSDRI